MAVTHTGQFDVHPMMEIYPDFKVFSYTNSTLTKGEVPVFITKMKYYLFRTTDADFSSHFVFSLLNAFELTCIKESSLSICAFQTQER